MNNTQEYIDSGILELFVFGALSEKESEEVASKVASDTALLQEVLHIEKAALQLSAAAAPDTVVDYKQLRKHLENGSIPLSRKRTNIFLYLGYAASVLLLAGLGYMYTENKSLEEKLTESEQELVLQEAKTRIVEEDLQRSSELLSVLRSNDVIKVPLGGQTVAPDAYAAVFWDKASQKAFVDVQGLPQPPEGKVYQVWSLTLDPLTPTSMGILDGYDKEGSQIFELENPNASEAFGITLEPEGGSKSPTLEQLYTLGAVGA